MLVSILSVLQIWRSTRRAYRELEALDIQSLEDIGLNPYEVPHRRLRF